MKDIVVPQSSAVVEGASASSIATAPHPQANQNSFGEVVSFVGQHNKLLVLSDASGTAAIAVWPAMQGRVLTSTAEGPEGIGFGWVNRDLIASGKITDHMYAVGGEDRIWLGPEGGQYSIFFAAGVPFDLDHWYTPAPIDTDPFDIVSQSETSVTFRRAFHLTNFSATKFHVQIEREVRLLSNEQIWSDLKVAAVAGVKVVGYESVNKLTNLDASSMSEKNGLLSLWVLGQFQSSPRTTIILPIKSGPEEELGIPVTSDYFGKVPADRIAVNPDSVLFKADSNYRSKLGVSPRRATGILGSYDAQNQALTIVQHSLPTGPEKYVNSAWKIQDDPYSGDVTNCYNDGPPSPGKAQMGQFYELESSSPAKELAPQQTVEHMQRTIHLKGAEAQLDAICQATLGVRLEVVRAFNQ
jgi:hypothetical protein